MKMPKCKHIWLKDLDENDYSQFFLNIHEDEKMDHLEKFDLIDIILNSEYFCIKCKKSHDESIQSKV